VSLTIALLVLIATGALWLYSSRSFALMFNYVDLNAASKAALNRMTQQIRQAQAVKSCTATALTLVDADGADLTFAYDAGAKRLTRTKGGTSEVLLPRCEGLAFSIFQRTPSAGTFDLSTATTNTCKVVQVSWTSSRPLLGQPVCLEWMQSAKVVLRNK
jgi:hypothetical protein